MRNQYTVTFKSVSYCDWKLEAESQEEAERIARSGEISDHGDFADEEQDSYDFINCELEQEDV